MERQVLVAVQEEAQPIHNGTGPSELTLQLVRTY
jgi:hypothetical protein